MGIRFRLTDWLRNDRAPRYPAPGIFAAYWGAGVPHLHPVKDISISGAYLYLDDNDRWPAGSVIEGVFQKKADNGEAAPNSPSLSISFLVARHGPDGIGISFMPHTKQERQDLRQFLDWILVP
jgi:hypothetical protein